jgi:hypothetical protein
MDIIYVIKILYALRLHANLKIKRNLSEFIADKIVQASSEPTLLGVVEKLAKLLNSDMGKIYDISGIDFLIIQKTDGLKYLNWLRQYPRIAAMIICLSKWKDIELACEQIEVEDIEDSEGQALPQGSFDIGINFTTISPLSHGSDQKAGNATLFRRMQVLSDTGNVLNLPFYAGNAIRGEIRDLLADHFLESIGIGVNKTNPKITKWFFHIIYSGGGLASDSEASKAFSEKLGKFGSSRAEEIHLFRDTLPFFSLLGGGLGNRILSGRINISDFRPGCYEWGNGAKKVHELFEWQYLTRRDDFEGHEEGENASMIANTECIKAGVKFYGGIDMSKHISYLEKAALGLGLELLQEKGYIGADNRRGFGKIKVELTNCPEPKLYLDFLKDKKDEILKYLNELNVFAIEKKIVKIAKKENK